VPGAEIQAGLDSLVLTGEQSNTSLVFGESAIFKVFRRVTPGPNPDLEVASALAQLGSSHIAEPFGWVETRIDGATTVLAILSRYLRAASDGWSLAATSVRDLYATEEGTRAAEAGGDFAGEAERLGAATAQVHRDLADAFGRSELEPEAIRELAEQMYRRLDMAVATVPELGRCGQGRRRVLGPGQADRAGSGPAGARRLPPGPGHTDPDRLGRARLRGRAGQPAGPAARPVLPAAGRGRHAPLVRLRGPAPARHPPGRVRPRAQGGRLGPAQRRRVLRRLRRGRRSDPAENSVLLRAMLLDKAVYEVIYEARNRPTWVPIPLESIAEL
jgi:Uncharacterized protein, probably involved in trehalose biosynthesis